MAEENVVARNFEVDINRSENKQVEAKRCFCGRYEGIFYSVLAAVTIVVFSAAVKYLKDFNVAELNMYTNVLCIIFILPVLILRNPKVFPLERKTIIFWTLCGLATVGTGIFRAAAFQMLPLGDASSIVFSTPFVTALFARVILKERLTWLTLVSLLLSGVGICLTVKLPLILTSEEFGERVGSLPHLIGCLYALGGLVLAAASFIIMRMLKGTSPYLNTVVNAATTGVLSACLVPCYGGFSRIPCDVSVVGAIILLGVCSVFGLLSLLRALQKEDPTTMSTVYRSTDIFLSFMVQVIVFQDSVDAYSASGALVIFACGMTMPLQRWMEGQPRWNKSFWLR